MADTNASHDVSSPIVPPADFPVSWERPEDEDLFWETDPMHFPEQVTPMMVGLVNAFNEGFKRASEASFLPIRLQYHRINTYLYKSIVPTVPPEEMEAQGKRSEEKLGAHMARMWEWWDTELLPDVKQHLDYWESFDLRGASMPALLAHWEDTQARLTRLWEIHFLIAFPFLMAMSLFAELYQDLFENEGALDAMRLLRGFGNKTVEAGHTLWDLRQLVAQRKSEMERFQAIQPPPSLGNQPPGPPPDNPLGRAIGKFFGTPPRAVHRVERLARQRLLSR